MLRVGLVAMGGSDWIAGVQYLHSILFGNSLLPTGEQALLHLYINPTVHRVSDYENLRSLAVGLHAADLESIPSEGVYKKLRRAARTVVRQHRLPALLASELPRLLDKHRIDVLFAGVQLKENINIPQICWIPDFQHIHRPDFFSPEERTRRDKLFKRILAQANAVIVSNQCSYADAARVYPENCQKLTVLPFTMYLGREWRKADPKPVLRGYNLPEKFLLLPSQFWKHKNHRTVFHAIKQLRDRGLKEVVLVCTGLPNDPRFPEYATELHQFISTHKLEEAIRVLGLLPRHDQVQLMRAAAAIIQPSLFEGWSAIVEESRSMGKEVFASDIPMHREQRTERVHLFDPMSVEGLTDLIYRYWPGLQPGPQPDLENTSEAEYYARIREFARQFAALSRSVMVRN